MAIMKMKKSTNNSRRTLLCLIVLLSLLCFKATAFIGGGPLRSKEKTFSKNGKATTCSIGMVSQSVVDQQQQVDEMNKKIQSTTKKNVETIRRPIKKESMMMKTMQLIIVSMIISIMLIAWEDLSMYKPMRQVMATATTTTTTTTIPFRSTIRGMAFGSQERLMLQDDIEPKQLQSIPSYNEVMLQHRLKRVASWEKYDSSTTTTTKITKDDVTTSVRTIQRAILHLFKCQQLAKDYEWDMLLESIRNPILHADLEKACDILKRADNYLSVEARDEIGFDWGSCAWRHCGALADAEEALDELDHLVGVLEPYECLFCIDVIERSFRDILAVTKEYIDPSIHIPEYQQLQRMSDMDADDEGSLEADYLAILAQLRVDDNSE